MSRQGLIEVALDRWVTSTELRFIRENYGAFYRDPLGHPELVDVVYADLEREVCSDFMDVYRY